MEFLFSRNRLNMAVSRAKCLTILVASPKLLDIRCRTVEQMRLANALCALVERADEPRWRRWTTGGHRCFPSDAACATIVEEVIQEQQ
jgi:hypothetical protein